MPTVTIDLSPDVDRRLREEAARRGVEFGGFLETTLSLVAAHDVDQLSQLLRERPAVSGRDHGDGALDRRDDDPVIALLDRWDAEDAARETPAGPPPVIPRFRLRE